MSDIYHRCEAMVRTNNGHYVMCGSLHQIEDHHRLTRARGGLILDKAGEWYHHMWLCHKHHMMAHGDDRASGLVLDGLVISCSVCSKPRYEGSDRYLKEKYGRGAHQHEQEDGQGHDRGEGSPPA